MASFLSGLARWALDRWKSVSCDEVKDCKGQRTSPSALGRSQDVTAILSCMGFACS
jgi:hypothetical protein